MKKLIFFISISMLILAGCSVKKDGNFTRVKIDKQRTVWVNQNVECCGIKDIVNNWDWLKEMYSYDFNYPAAIFLFRDTITNEDYIVRIRKYRKNPNECLYSIKYCNGESIDGGHGGIGRYSNIDGGAYLSYLKLTKNDKYMKRLNFIQRGPNYKRKKYCKTCDEFFQTHVLTDTISYLVIKPKKK